MKVKIIHNGKTIGKDCFNVKKLTEHIATDLVMENTSIHMQIAIKAEKTDNGFKVFGHMGDSEYIFYVEKCSK
jgi:hypothetical protein